MASEHDDRVAPALQAFLSSDAAALDRAIAADPGVVHLVWKGNTLLEWATQPPHGVAPEVIDVLIARDARLDRALNLAGCWDLAGLCRQLLAAGADPTARADANITPLESAAMHGSTDSADVLIEHGLHRPSLWLAAAAGRIDLVTDWVAPDGAPRKPAGAYRPNWADVGRAPGAAPTDHTAEILGEALVFAAANDRQVVVDHLLDIGVGIDSRPYRNTTGLHLAIQFHKPRMVRHLLDRGASVDVEDDEHHSTAHGWAQACDDGSPAATDIRTQMEAIR